MAIEILIPEGAADKAHYKFDDTQNRITIGREGGSSDVVFAADQTLVSRQHLALDRKFDGVYEIDLRDGRYVEVDGKPAQEGQALSGKHTIRLGGPKGPELTLTVEQHSVAEKTARQKAMPDIRKASARNRRLVGMALALIVLVGGAIGYYVYDREQAFSPRVMQDVRQSVMLAAMRNTKTGAITPNGTAWVVGAGMLATNAHVVFGILDESNPDIEQVVVGADGTVYPVRDVRVHEAYLPFAQFAAQSNLAVDSAQGGAKLENAGGYDVGLLFVDDSSDKPLPPPLELAPLEEIQTLPLGTKVALIGYPMEQIVGSAAQALNPLAQTQFGALTSQGDFLFLNAAPEHRQLLVHTLPIAGGASGSPIFLEDGRVIGLAHAGNMYHNSENGRIMSAALINYGMRIDILTDMMSGEDGDKLEYYRAHWAEQAARITTEQSIVLANLERDWLSKAMPNGGEPVVVAEYVTTMKPGTGTDKRLQVDHVLDRVETGKHYFASAVSDAGIVLVSHLFFADNSQALTDFNPFPFTTLRFNVPSTYENMRVKVAGPVPAAIPEGTSYDVKIRIIRTP